MKSIDACLSERDGHLFIEEMDAVSLIENFGSPLFVFSEDQLMLQTRDTSDYRVIMLLLEL